MTVYVDDMEASYGRMVMCHMVADTDEELHAMADRIGVARSWHQKADTPQSHYDICEWHPVDSGHSGKVGAWNGETFLPGWGDIKDRSKNMVRAGKSAFGARLLDGIEHNGFPKDSK